MKTMLRLLLDSFTFLCLQAAMPIPVAGADATTTADSAKPDLSSLKYGLYIHFGMATFANPGEQGEIPAERFAPTALNVKSWAHTAKEAGMTFAVLTAKHESGFCLWDSAGYDYDIAQSPVKTDLLADFIAACNAEGIAPGVHYSIPDGYNEGAVRIKGPVPPPYFSVIERHITELHTKYPGIRVQIFDDDGRRLTPAQYHELCQIIQQLNPQCVILNHNYEPRHISATVIRGWMWRPGAQLNTAQQLFPRYNQSVTDGCSFVLNVAPDRTGTIPANQIAVLMDMKNLIANPPPAGSPAPADNSAKPSAADRLKQVKSLYDQGLINKDDYDKKVKEIMDSL
jgi:alpha-L-fucosidase